MKLTLNIETTDTAALARVVAALNGEVAPEPVAKPASRAAGKPKEPAASSGTAASSAQGSTQADASTSSASGQSATTAASPSEQPVPSDAELVAAANAAVAKLGVSGPQKLKDYIAANFRKTDGSPGTLMSTAADQRSNLLTDLQRVGRGEITL
ncbi:MAG: hypothetical protein IPM11_01315 [Micropruina sp.]|nr:hypothetical protein [Micropruina sp.]